MNDPVSALEEDVEPFTQASARGFSPANCPTAARTRSMGRPAVLIHCPIWVSSSLQLVPRSASEAIRQSANSNPDASTVSAPTAARTSMGMALTHGPNHAKEPAAAGTAGALSVRKCPTRLPIDPGRSTVPRVPGRVPGAI